MDEEEGGDQFQIEITVTDPKKMGDGMGSYMAYKVNTKVGFIICLHVYKLVRFENLMGQNYKNVPVACFIV